MTPAQLKEIEELARDNPVVHALLDLRRRRIVSDEDWVASALVAIARQNSTLLSMLAEEYGHRPLPPVVLEGVERDGTKLTFRVAVSPEMAAALKDADDGGKG
jgi:hypothetical protein